MVRAGLSGAIIGFIYVMSLTLLSPFCTLCLTPFLGFGVGYLANQLDQPAAVSGSLSRGSIAGVMTSFGIILGQMGAMLVVGILVTNFEVFPPVINGLDLSQFFSGDTEAYWQTTLMLSSICSIFNLVVVTGLAAAGGAIWFQRKYQQQIGAL